MILCESLKKFQSSYQPLELWLPVGKSFLQNGNKGNSLFNAFEALKYPSANSEIMIQRMSALRQASCPRNLIYSDVTLPVLT